MKEQTEVGDAKHVQKCRSDFLGGVPRRNEHVWAVGVSSAEESSAEPS